LLGEFHQRYAGAADELQLLCSEGRRGESFVLVHTIRGAAVNLGMQAVSDAAMALEAILEETHEGSWEEALPRFAAAMASVCGGLAGLPT
jgi:HPt (histidine-containing phosphotransfer) domain-containing protein